jgi:hypothetical protein
MKENTDGGGRGAILMDVARETYLKRMHLNLKTGGRRTPGFGA